MTRSIAMALIVSSFGVRAQSLEGVYAGKILSEKNVFVISVVAETVIGSIYLSSFEKLIFMGTARGLELNGMAQTDSVSLKISGKLEGDSLVLLIGHNGNNQLRKLARVSRNSRYNVAKLLKPGPNRDPKLIGTWLLLWDVSKQDPRKKKDRRASGFSFQFNADGSCIMRSNELTKFYTEMKAQPVRATWETNGNSFIVTVGDQRTLSTESPYIIKGDTLISLFKETKSVYVRTWPKGKAK